MRAQNELNLRGSEAVLLKLENPLKILERCAGKYFSGSLFNLGVYSFRGLDFGGDVIMSDLGDRPKKDFFIAATWRAKDDSLSLKDRSAIWRGYFTDNFSADGKG